MPHVMPPGRIVRAAAATLVAGGLAGAEPRKVVDLRYPPRGIVALETPVNPMEVYHLGDIDGDGHGDVLMSTWDIVGDPRQEKPKPGLIAFGRRDIQDHSGGKLLDLRHTWIDTSLEMPLEGRGVSRLGDLDGDGFGDFLLTSLDLGHLGSRGFRLLCKEGNRLSSFKAGIAAGDFDGDGRRDLAVGEAVEEATGSRKRVLLIFGTSEKGRFVRGDPNGDAIVKLTDAVFVLQYLFQGGLAPSCLDAADTDDTGALDVTDAVYLLRHLFQGTEAPPAPYPDPGPDPTTDPLGCRGF